MGVMSEERKKEKVDSKIMLYVMNINHIAFNRKMCACARASKNQNGKYPFWFMYKSKRGNVKINSDKKLSIGKNKDF